MSHSGRVTMRERDLAASFVTVHDGDETPRAHLAPKREVRRGAHARRSW